MQRQFISFYQKHLRGFMRLALPLSVRAALTGALFRATCHPDLGFRHVRQLLELGRGARAAQIYSTSGSDIDALNDPLFEAALTPVVATRIHAEFGYRGLWLGGKVPASKWLGIRLDGKELRREKLRGASAFRYIIGRDALELFPLEGMLDVVDDKGKVLGAWQVAFPSGQGGLIDAIARKGPLEKKGGLRADPAELAVRHNAYLALYSRVNAAFVTEFGKPIFILYGTLLGQHRSGGFIPGDDDFDVGYVSEQTDFDAVSDEAVQMIERLVVRGFTVSLNIEGKPFRIRDDAAGPGIWLDNRPVFSPGDGYVWLHKQARLPMSMDDFRAVEKGQLRGCDIAKPRDSEAFLAAYYGPGWRVPDPGFSNATKGIDPQVIRGLAAVNLSISQQKELAKRIAAQNLPGRFAPLALQKLYPLAKD